MQKWTMTEYQRTAQKELQPQLQNTNHTTDAHLLVGDELVGDEFPDDNWEHTNGKYSVGDLPSVTGTLNDGAFFIDSSKFSSKLLRVSMHACTHTTHAHMCTCMHRLACNCLQLPTYGQFHVHARTYAHRPCQSTQPGQISAITSKVQ